MGKCVYLMLHEQGPIKIGISSCPEKRLEKLKTASPFEMELLHTIETDNPKQHERLLHREFEEHRVTREWFDLPDEHRKALLGVDSFVGMSTEEICRLCLA